MALRTYEAFVIVAEAAPANSNLEPDEFNGGLTLPASVSLTPAEQIKVWDGPGIPAPAEWLDEYARCQLISTGKLFMSGYAPRGAWLDHDAAPGSWVSAGSQPGQMNTYSSNWQNPRHDGSTVLFPNLGGTYDTIVRLCGAIDFEGQVTATMESIDASNINSTWVSGPGIPNQPSTTPGPGRVFINTVLLPTGGVLVLGGIWQNGPGTQTPVYSPTIFENGAWDATLKPNVTPSQRGYHSTAVLLPDGRIFLGGGNDRDFDYEIYSPAYLNVPANRPVNPVWITEPTVHPTLGAYILDRNTEYTIAFDPLPLGQEFTKAVLMAPCSVTHHSDMSQRYVEVNCTPDGDKVHFSLGPQHGQTVVPPGIYMLFFVTNASVSHAEWVMFL